MRKSTLVKRVLRSSELGAEKNVALYSEYSFQKSVNFLIWVELTILSEKV
jgi:hypothetical protein